MKNGIPFVFTLTKLNIMRHCQLFIKSLIINDYDAVYKRDKLILAPSQEYSENLFVFKIRKMHFHQPVIVLVTSLCCLGGFVIIVRIAPTRLRIPVAIKATVYPPVNSFTCDAKILLSSPPTP
jgi:hypothetical protein